MYMPTYYAPTHYQNATIVYVKETKPGFIFQISTSYFTDWKLLDH